LLAELPIVCSLNATDLRTRLTEIAELGREALLDAHINATRAELRFAAGEGVRARVDAIVAAESQCCAFLEMAVTEEPDSLRLTITGPAGSEAVIDDLVDAFRA